MDNDEIKARVYINKITLEQLEHNIKQMQIGNDKSHEQICKKIEELESALKDIKSNTLLKFTQNMTLKEYVVVITIIFSIATSSGIVDEVFGNDPVNVELLEKLEVLLDEKA